ncbi:MAG: hypothetical protein ACKV2O_21500 [Acidimicrobiales bacterium]
MAQRYCPAGVALLVDRGADDLLTERLLRVIDEGRRTATYKLALLLGLIDAIALVPGQHEIPTRDLAERVVALYYPQTREYVANDGIARELRQISMKSSAPLQAMLRLRLQADAAGCRTVHESKRRIPAEYNRAVDRVEDVFVRYPIPLLQVVGGRSMPFLYEVDWPEGTAAATLRNAGGDRIRLLPGVADRLVVLGPLLRPLIELVGPGTHQAPRPHGHRHLDPLAVPTRTHRGPGAHQLSPCCPRHPAVERRPDLRAGRWSIRHSGARRFSVDTRLRVETRYRC